MTPQPRCGARTIAWGMHRMQGLMRVPPPTLRPWRDDGAGRLSGWAVPPSGGRVEECRRASWAARPCLYQSKPNPRVGHSRVKRRQIRNPLRLKLVIVDRLAVADYAFGSGGSAHGIRVRLEPSKTDCASPPDGVQRFVPVANILDPRSVLLQTCAGKTMRGWPAAGGLSQGGQGRRQDTVFRHR